MKLSIHYFGKKTNKQTQKQNETKINTKLSPQQIRSIVHCVQQIGPSLSQL